jgi:hypothetical protein
MPRKSPYEIKLLAEDADRLQEMARKYTSPHYQVVRAKVILLAAQGLENKEIGERLDLPRQIVSKWRKRFFHHGLRGLEDEPRPGRPRHFSPRNRG